MSLLGTASGHRGPRATAAAVLSSRLHPNRPQIEVGCEARSSFPFPLSPLAGRPCWDEPIGV